MTRNFRSLSLMIVFLGLMGTGCAQSDKAYRFFQNGYAFTDLKFDEFFDDSFTMTAWVMPQFSYSFAAPIFGVNGSGFFAVGQNTYKKSSQGIPILFVRVGHKSAHYSAPGYLQEVWSHVALVHRVYRGASTFELYLNGERLNPVSGESDVSGFVNGSPVGRVQFGRRRYNSTTQINHSSQFLGILDEVGVYSRDLESLEIKQVMNGGLEVFLNDLIAGWTFDEYSDQEWNTLDPRFKRPLQLATVNPTEITRRVEQIAVSANIDSAADAAIFRDEPARSGAYYRLPFPTLEIWKVTFGVNDPTGSHLGRWAFCWDFIKLSGEPADVKAVTTAAAGFLVDVVENDVAPPGKQEKNKALIQVANSEYNTYLHLAEGSVTDYFIDPNGYSDIPQLTDPSTSVPIGDNIPLAEYGPRADHLHFCTFNGVGPVHATMPIVFRDYFVKNDDGSNDFIPIGIPQAGEKVFW